jgi:hypothetical protein
MSSEYLRIIALRNVIKGDDEYFLRRVFRFYSETFHTPLHMVPDLPLDDVILTYYETHFEKLEPKDLETERLAVIESPEDLRARQMEEDRDDADVFETLKEIAAEQTAEAVNLDQMRLPKKTSPIHALQKLVNDVGLATEELRKPDNNIDMRFDDLDEDSFGLLGQPAPVKKPRNT